jgi:uncharacterized protein YndB with AHSA1/START domain
LGILIKTIAMNTKTDFQIDHDNLRIIVERNYPAPLTKVWEAWTKPEYLDQWWGPQPWRAETILMNFKEGGKWFYAMVGPEGEREYCAAEFNNIQLHKFIEINEYFADENGDRRLDAPGAYWTEEFVEEGNSTKVKITIRFQTEEDMKWYIQSGFEQGFSIGLQNLSEVLQSEI